MYLFFIMLMVDCYISCMNFDSVVYNSSYLLRPSSAGILDELSRDYVKNRNKCKISLESLGYSHDLVKFRRNLKNIMADLDKAYGFYKTEPIAYIILYIEFNDTINELIHSFEDKLIEILKISSMCILDASPGGNVKRYLLLLSVQDLVDEASTYLKAYNIDYRPIHLDDVFNSIIFKQGLDIRYWSLVHYKAVKRGIIMVTKLLALAILNKIIIPILLNNTLQWLPQDHILSKLFKYINLNIN